MNLDEFIHFQNIDPENMLRHIDNLPQQLETAWDLGMRQPLPDSEGIEQVVIAGMGGSAIGADLLAAYLEPLSRVPVVVHRDYGLPAWATGRRTLVVASSHSGNTEETLSSFSAAVERDCRCMVVSTGGKLAEEASRRGIPVWRFEHHGQPRTAVGFSFGMLLALTVRLKLLPDQSAEIAAAANAMRRQQEQIGASVPVVNNPAKRMAGQLLGRHVAVFGSGVLAPVARRWKGQISEVSKAWAQFEFLPEADHNTLAGMMFPSDLLSRTKAVFLRAGSNHPRNLLRIDLTKHMMMLEGIQTDFIDAQGETPLEHQWTCLHFGDYTAYYLAMVYEVDPTPVEALAMLKEELASK